MPKKSGGLNLIFKWLEIPTPPSDPKIPEPGTVRCISILINHKRIIRGNREPGEERSGTTCGCAISMLLRLSWADCCAGKAGSNRETLKSVTCLSQL